MLSRLYSRVLGQFIKEKDMAKEFFKQQLFPSNIRFKG